MLVLPGSLEKAAHTRPLKCGHAANVKGLISITVTREPFSFVSLLALHSNGLRPGFDDL